jgi:predicted unusual protein kinase regulating ubiquinone biosynthesis (AarF/ABC1/UbiB family)
LLQRALGRPGAETKSAAELVLSLGELKGVAMKVGQILSYMDAGLPEEVRAQLALLQTRSQPTAFADIERILREEFGERAETLLQSLERTPVATASIGQVHRGELVDGMQVAVKVRHPGIDAAIRADFRAASTGKLLARLLAPGVEVAELLQEAESRFLEECDYVLEREHQERFAGLYPADGNIVIPTVQREWCSTRVLTTNWVTGLTLDQFVETSPQTARDRAAEALYTFYLGTLYVTVRGPAS